MSTTLTVGGIVLCGGRSTRMGRSKAWLPFGNELLLPRVVRILAEAVSPVVVVAAREQSLPALPPGTLVARDEQDALGPLAGIAAGLAALPAGIDAVYVSACDAPLLRPAFVQQLIECLGHHDLAIPLDGQHHHPLAAVYRTSVGLAVRALLSQGRLRTVDLMGLVRTREVAVDELRSADGDLSSLRNVNTPGEYAAILRASEVRTPAP